MTVDLDIRLALGDFRLEVASHLDAPVTGVFGPSGAGKTTLLHLIAGLLRPDAGRIAVAGTTLVDTDAGIWVPPQKRRIGLVFQEGRLFPHRSVRGNLRFGERLLPKHERKVRLDDVLALLEIGPLLDRAPNDLSGGERQRVAVGRALLSSPRLLLLDEPVAAVDIGLRRQILPFLQRVRAELGIPMLVVSHDLADLLRLTNHMLLLDGGATVGSGHYFDLVQEKRLLGLVRGSGLVNMLQLVVREHNEGAGIALLEPAEPGPGGPVVIRAPLDPHMPPGSMACVSLPAYDIGLAPAPVEHISIRNQLRGRIERMVENGGETVCIIDAGVKLIVEITPGSAGEMHLEPGSEVWCLFKARSLHLFHCGFPPAAAAD